MKILTGRFKGRSIEFRPSADLRPTHNKVRKAIVDAFAGWLEDKRILDLYSGTGALGFELLSAGAAGADFVERDAACAKRIRDWLAKQGLGSECRVWADDAERALKKLADAGERFDLAVLDPPYDDPRAPALLPRLGAVLNDEAFVVYECREDRKAPEAAGLKKVRDKIYGDTRLVVYRKA